MCAHQPGTKRNMNLHIPLSWVSGPASWHQARSPWCPEVVPPPPPPTQPGQSDLGCCHHCSCYEHPWKAWKGASSGSHGPGPQARPICPVVAICLYLSSFPSPVLCHYSPCPPFLCLPWALHSNYHSCSPCPHGCKGQRNTYPEVTFPCLRDTYPGPANKPLAPFTDGTNGSR
jgi:hypothetical protein